MYFSFYFTVADNSNGDEHVAGPAGNAPSTPNIVEFDTAVCSIQQSKAIKECHGMFEQNAG